MVLTTRAIGPVSIHPSSYQQTPQQLLDTVAGDKLVSLLRQIAQLSDYAAEIFNSPPTRPYEQRRLTEHCLCTTSHVCC